MKAFISYCEVIADLHERGFTDDFKITRKGVVWLQERIVFKMDDFEITECHRFLDRTGEQIMICGVMSPVFQVKGILLIHNFSHTSKRASFIEKKIGEKYTHVSS